VAIEDIGDNTQEAAAGLAGVGARLSSARKKQQIDLNAVAGELHLRVEVLRALEAGDEAGLPSPAFTRGYVRSYARVLGMDADELLAQLPQSDEYRVTPIGRAMGSRHGARPQVARLLLWMLLLGVIAAVVMYGVPVVERWVDSPQVEADSGQLELPLAEDISVSTEKVSAGAPLVDLPPVAEPESGIDKESAMQPDPVVDAPLLEKREVMATAGEIAVEVDALQQESSAVQATAEEQPVTQATKSELLLRFRQDSWVEVDAGGRRLLAGIEAAGTERRLEVEPPIQVLLGNAPGVELIYNGEVMDTESYRKGKVARIMLEKN
jgi:cytoskeleton protein RodZ